MSHISIISITPIFDNILQKTLKNPSFNVIYTFIHGGNMKKTLVFAIIILVSSAIFAQQKHALVIGNSYPNEGADRILNNTVLDANAMEATLRNLGFTVVKVINGDRIQMQNAIMNYKSRLSASRDAYGFFFYSGHGIQVDSESYLIPVNADLPDPDLLQDRAISLNFIMSLLNREPRNQLNMIVLDSCRDNPYADQWGRNKSTRVTRGIGVTQRIPGSIVMYAAAPNAVADDGVAGSTSPFTTQLVNNLRTPGLNILQVFNNTMSDVARNSNGRQHPELSLMFTDGESIFLNGRGNNPSPNPQPIPPVQSLYDQLVNARGTSTITVTEDTTLSSVTLSNATSITLRGNTSGRTVMGNGNDRILIERGVTLILESITLNGISISVKSGGSLTMNNSSAIIGNNDIGVGVSGIFTMNDGRIANNENDGGNGGGVDIINGGTFTMNGGRIENNRAYLDGGGVYIAGGTFTMNGGRIENNRASHDGGGVAVQSFNYDIKGRFYMRGGVIAGNSAYKGGGVYVQHDSRLHVGGAEGIFIKTGGIIYGSNERTGLANTASDKGDAVYLSKDMNMIGTVVRNRTIGSNNNINFD
jgi:hypothetical protein